MFKLRTLLLAVGLSVSSLSFALTEAEKKAVSAALEGTKLEKHRLYDHRWNFRKINTQFNDDTFRVSGHFRHYKRWAHDDRVTFTVVMKNGKIDEDKSDIDIDEAIDWRVIAWDVIKFVINLISGNDDEVDSEGDISKDTLDAFIDSIDRIAEVDAGDSWQEQSQKVVLLLAKSAFLQESTVSAFRDRSQEGRKQLFAKGRYNSHELNVVGNNKISSLKIGKGVQVKVCDRTNAAGTCRTYRGDKVNLPANLDNKVSSVTVEKRKVVSRPQCTNGRTKSESCAPLNGVKNYRCENGRWKLVSGGCGFMIPPLSF